jgi:hypothetical protein
MASARLRVSSTTPEVINAMRLISSLTHDLPLLVCRP